MRRWVAALAWMLLCLTHVGTADAGPIKHWGMFPGWTVRAIALRGYDIGAEPSYRVEQGRDGYLYVRGRWGLYRVIDDRGDHVQVANTDLCGGFFESHGVDARSATPHAICSRAQVIIVAAARWHRHLRAPMPPRSWPRAIVPIDGYPAHYRDNRFLTHVVAAPTGGYWFAYGEIGAVGRIGSTHSFMLRLPDFGEIQGLAAVGNDAYVGDDSCHLAHLRGTELVGIWKYPCRSDDTMVVTPVAGRDGAVWILRVGNVERIGGDGSRRRWSVAMRPTSLATTRDGIAYVIGTGIDYGYTIAVLGPGQEDRIALLPMDSAEAISMDDRGRLWISAPHEHGLALITPPSRKKEIAWRPSRS
jgi:hypothetical protein